MEDGGRMEKKEAMRKLREQGLKGGLEKRDKWGDTPLTGAARRGREEMAALLVQAGADVNGSPPTGEGVNVVDGVVSSPLMMAARGGLDRLAIMLIDKGARVNAKDSYGSTALMKSTRAGHESLGLMLIEKGADVNLEDEAGETALNKSAEAGLESLTFMLIETGNDRKRMNEALVASAAGGHESLALKLLEKGADVNARDKNGWTALMKSALRANESFCHMLIEKGADVNAKSKDGTTLLMVSASGGLDSFARMLIEKGADVNAKNANGRTALMYGASGNNKSLGMMLVDKGADVHAKSKNGLTVLMASARGGHDDFARIVINKGADVNAKDEDGWTALMWSASGNNESLCMMLVDKGADLNAKSKDGATALMLSAQEGGESVAVMLIEKGADVNATNKKGSTALMVSASFGHESVGLMLLEHGADANSKSKEEETALMLSAENGLDRLAVKLIEKGADVEAKDQNRSTALIFSALGSQESVGLLLLEQGADANAQNKDGNTALIVSAEKGLDRLAVKLIEKGADVEAKDKFGSTALMCSALEAHESVGLLLLEHGADANGRNKNCMTALLWSAANDLDSLTIMLLERGADVNVKNNGGESLLDLAIAKGNTEFVERLRKRSKVVWAQGIGTAVTAGGVQFFDFVSDVVVVAYWGGVRQDEMAERGLGWIFRTAIGFMSFSVLVGMFFTYFRLFGASSDRESSFTKKMCLTLLLPALNLHVLFMGLKREQGRGLHDFWFFLSKVIETLLESVPLSLLMVVDLVTPSTDGSSATINPVTASSLGLSVVSMAYGIAANAIDRHEISGGWRVLETFLLMMLDVIWFLAAVGLWIATPALVDEYALFLVVGLFIGFFSGEFVLLMFFDGRLEKYISEAAASLSRKFTSSFSKSLIDFTSAIVFIFVLVMGTALAEPFVLFDAKYSVAFASDVSVITNGLVLWRRLFLLGLSVLGLTYLWDLGGIEPVWVPSVCVTVLFFAHSYFSLRFYHTIGDIQFDVRSLPLRFLSLMWGKGRVVPSETESGQGVMSFEEAALGEDQGSVLAPPKVHGAFQGMPLAGWREEGLRKFVDVTEAVLLCENFKGGQNVPLGPGGVEAVQDLVNEVLRQIGVWADGGGGTLPAIVDDGRRELEKYMPDAKDASGQGTTAEPQKSCPHEVALIADIKRVLAAQPGGGGTGAGVGGTGEQSSARGERSIEVFHLEEDGVQTADVQGGDGASAPHIMGSEEEGRELEEGLEMRGLRVQDAVNLSLWASSRGSPQTFEQTVRVDVCGSFLSHSWHDNAKVKVGQLRLHLMLHKVYAAASVMALLLALQLLPVGFMIQGLIDSQQAPVWFWPSVGALGLGALVVLWANWTGVYLPARWGPWWSTKETVWLDKSCIDQTSDKTKQAGIARLKDYLAKCDTMVVLLGKTYFNRLWCTYELACFCRMHGQEELDDKLKFVSLEWGWFERLAWLFGCGRVRLSKSEHELLANYSCRDASCFMPKDRGTVLARIREEWGSEEEFDGFVRREFPKLVLKGKERFMWRPVRVLKETLDLLF